MMQISKLAGYALAGLALSACGGGTQPTQTQRDALRKPLLETDYKLLTVALLSRVMRVVIVSVQILMRRWLQNQTIVLLQTQIAMPTSAIYTYTLLIPLTPTRLAR